MYAPSGECWAHGNAGAANVFACRLSGVGWMVDTVIDWSFKHTFGFESASAGFTIDLISDAGPTAVVASAD